MFRSLSVKLVLIFVVFIISVMTVVGIILIDRVNVFYTDDFEQQMQNGFSGRVRQELVDSLVREDFAKAQKEILVAYSGSFSFDSYRNFYILDMNGNVLESSADDNEDVFKTKNLLSAMNRKTDENVVSGTEYFDYAIYLENEGNECIVYVKDNLTRMKSLIWVLFSIIMQALLIGLVIALVLAFFLTSVITSPIQKLTAGAKTISSGEYDYRIDNPTKDEIGELTDNFNTMAQAIENTMAQVSGEREKLQTIFGCLEDGVAAFDENGKMLHINHAAYKMLGVSEKRKLDFNGFTKALGMPEITCGILGSSTEINISEYTLSDKANKELIVDVGFNVFTYEKNKKGYLIVIQDITDRALLEKGRREFIANVSHELRTPLTSIKGATEIVLADKDMPERMRTRFLSIVMNEADRMTRIVKDLLVLSRLENRRMSWKLSRFSLPGAVSQICDALKTEAGEHSHTLKYTTSLDESHMISADKERIEQVLTNIIGNSIKYTPNGGRIDVILGPSVEDKFDYKIVVRDTGMGIAEEKIPRLFERFYRVDKARNSDVGGTGLGLSIAKEIVDAHHGNIAVESTVGVGTTVTVLLPRETAVCDPDYDD